MALVNVASNFITDTNDGKRIRGVSHRAPVLRTVCSNTANTAADHWLNGDIGSILYLFRLPYASIPVDAIMMGNQNMGNEQFNLMVYGIVKNNNAYNGVTIQYEDMYVELAPLIDAGYFSNGNKSYYRLNLTRPMETIYERVDQYVKASGNAVQKSTWQQIQKGENGTVMDSCVIGAKITNKATTAAIATTVMFEFFYVDGCPSEMPIAKYSV